MIGMRIRTPRKQLVAARIVIVIFNDNAGGGNMVVLMVGCLVEFVKEFCNLENIEVFLVLQANRGCTTEAVNSP